MRSNHSRHGNSRRFEVLLGSTLLLPGLFACDDVSEPSGHTTDEIREQPRAALLSPGSPRLASAQEVAMLNAAGAAEEPPQIPGLSVQSSANAAATTCSIDFADYIGLLILPQQAGYTFASSPFYIQGCGSGWVHVKENDVARYGPSFGSAYGHYHLMYEKGPYCVPSGGSYGYKVGSSCIKVTTPANEPRYLQSHYGDEWVRIYVYKSGVSEMTFDLKSIRVKPSQPIKLWFRTAGGAWYVWNSLGTGTWNLAQYSSGIREVLIRAAGGALSPYAFDDVVVGVN